MFIKNIKKTTLACCLFLSGGSLCAETANIQVQVPIAASPILNIKQEATVGWDGGSASDKAVTIKPGDVVHFTMQITNTGTAPATDALLLVNLPKGLIFKGNLFTHDMTIPTFSSGQTLLAHGLSIPVSKETCPGVEVRFSALVDAPIPEGVTKLKSVAEMLYLTYPEGGPVEGTATVTKSNPLRLVFQQPMVIPYPILKMTQVATNSEGKTKKKLNVCSGDVLTLTFNISNFGDASDFATFQTLLPDGLSYVADSFLVNDKSDPSLINSVQPTHETLLASSISTEAKGNPGDTGTISFKVKVDSVPPAGVTTFTNNGMLSYFGAPGTVISTASSNNVVLTLQ